MTGGELRITGGTVAGNIADYGGGLSFYAGRSAIEDVRVSGNLALTGGGLLAYRGADVELQGGEVVSNAASGRGGGAYLEGDGSQALVETRFAGNTAWVGGGVYTYQSGTEQVLEGVQLDRNRALQGGGVGLRAGSDATPAALVQTEVTRNIALEGGGAWLESDDEMVSTECDWGTGPRDNAPDDVDGEQGSWSDLPATFTCAGGVCE